MKWNEKDEECATELQKIFLSDRRSNKTINYIYTLFNLHSIIFPLFRVRATRASDSLCNKMKSYGFRPLWPLTVDHSCPIRRCASMFVLAIAMKSEITCRNVDLVKNTNWSKTLPLVHAKTKHLKHFCFLFVALRFVFGSQRWLGFNGMILYGVADSVRNNFLNDFLSKFNQLAGNKYWHRFCSLRSIANFLQAKMCIFVWCLWYCLSHSAANKNRFTSEWSVPLFRAKC